MELGPEAAPIGEHIARGLQQIAANMTAALADKIAHVEAGMRLHEDLPSWTPAILETLKSAAHDAKDRGAEIAITTRGMLVRKNGKCEIVRFDQIEGGMLHRALDRVAPHAWERE